MSKTSKPSKRQPLPPPAIRFRENENHVAELAKISAKQSAHISSLLARQDAQQKYLEDAVSALARLEELAFSAIKIAFERGAFSFEELMVKVSGMAACKGLYDFWGVSVPADVLADTAVPVATEKEEQAADAPGEAPAKSPRKRKQPAVAVATSQEELPL